MPLLNTADATLVMPLWAMGAVLILLIVLVIVALRRSAMPGSISALFGIPALVVIGWAAWTSVEQTRAAQQIAERQGLDARFAQLTASAIAPGSPLPCLDAMAGQGVEASCERAIFSTPQSVAAAAAYIQARLRLLADGLNFVRTKDRGYQNSITPLQHALEVDPFGIVAHVLAVRDGCTPQQCQAFALFRDANAVKANLQSQAYEARVSRYAAGWAEQMGANASAAPPPTNPAAASAIAGKPFNFPGAAAIPPVSIMNAEPPSAPGATARDPAGADNSPPR
ncbi:MAG TPA: hypothetical protein VFA53_01940 [Xanthobacteraceae bacterium]|nr:hypothetical protein [Xanthobacteraceae bacterium]